MSLIFVLGKVNGVFYYLNIITMRIKGNNKTFGITDWRKMFIWFRLEFYMKNEREYIILNNNSLSSKVYVYMKNCGIIIIKIHMLKYLCVGYLFC